MQYARKLLMALASCLVLGGPSALADTCPNMVQAAQYLNTALSNLEQTTPRVRDAVSQQAIPYIQYALDEIRQGMTYYGRCDDFSQSYQLSYPVATHGDCPYFFAGSDALSYARNSLNAANTVFGGHRANALNDASYAQNALFSLQGPLRCHP